jgi:hypothetical protein
VTAVNLSFTSRPTRMVDFGVKYRSYDYDNRTPEFLMTERQAYDNAPSVLTEAVHTEPFGIVRHSFDADLRVTPIRFASAAVGYGRIKEERNHRAFESTTEDIVRVTFDSVGNQYFSVRSRFEHSERKAEGFDVGALTHANEQPGMRHFDVAARDRNRFTLLGTMMPVADLAITTSVAWGEDDYNQSVFGLRDNTHRVYGLGFDATPAEQISVGLSYSYERYYALSRSRQANPGVQFDDPSRNWASEGTDRAHSFLFSVEFLQIADRVDLMLSYDFNRARATYNYITGAVANRTLPEEVVVTTTLPTPTQLPPTFSELQRAVTNLTYWTTSRLGLGLSYWYERYDVRDFTLDVESTPNLARGSTLLMGYLYQPYRANTVWGRLIYRW